MKKKAYITPKMEEFRLATAGNMLVAASVLSNDGLLEELVISEEEYEGVFQ